MPSVLVIDDEVPLQRALSIGLSARGYEVFTASSGEDGLAQAAEHRPEFVILDIGLPGIDGIDVLRALRSWSSVPVIVLSARHSEEAKVDALDAGADDYVTKPFGINELMARLRAVGRRRMPVEQSPAVSTPDFVVDLASRRVTSTAGEQVHLTPTEWRILEVLIGNRDRLVSQRYLLQTVWGPEYDSQTEYLRTYMAAIRRKLEPEPSNPRYFLTEPRVGYRFVGAVDVDATLTPAAS